MWILSFDQLAEAKCSEVEALLNADFSGSRCLESRLRITLVILSGIKLLVMELWGLPVLGRELLRKCIRLEFILVSPVVSFQHALALIWREQEETVMQVLGIICLLNSFLRQLMSCSKEAPFLVQRDLSATPLTHSVQWLLMRCQLIPFTRD